jgi:hypothetical protein
MTTDAESHDGTPEEPTRREERSGFDWEGFVADQGEQLAELASATATTDERPTVQAAIANAHSIVARLEQLLPAPPSTPPA